MKNKVKKKNLVKIEKKMKRFCALNHLLFQQGKHINLKSRDHEEKSSSALLQSYKNKNDDAMCNLIVLTQFFKALVLFI